MLTITIPSYELFNDVTQEFISEDERVIQLEHSLLAISEWESRWNKPFLSNMEKTSNEIIDYVRCMTLTEGVPETAYLYIDNEQYKLINDYIAAPMTATTISEPPGKVSREIMTSELLYYYMIAANIPFECERWHLNRLLTLIRICSIKSQPEKKRPINEVMKSNAALNAARKKQFNTKG
jgi:hypothetical protein